jgi:hypothetical protein
VFLTNDLLTLFFHLVDPLKCWSFLLIQHDKIPRRCYSEQWCVTILYNLWGRLHFVGSLIQYNLTDLKISNRIFPLWCKRMRFKVVMTVNIKAALFSDVTWSLVDPYQCSGKHNFFRFHGRISDFYLEGGSSFLQKAGSHYQTAVSHSRRRWPWDWKMF